MAALGSASAWVTLGLVTRNEAVTQRRTLPTCQASPLQPKAAGILAGTSSQGNRTMVPPNKHSEAMKDVAFLSQYNKQSLPPLPLSPV